MAKGCCDALHALCQGDDANQPKLGQMLSRSSEAPFIIVWDKGRMLKVCEKLVPRIHKEKSKI
jgi:hypothetical protein